jgi:hypothetical protein
VETEAARPMGAEDSGAAGGEEEHFSARISTVILYSGGTQNDGQTLVNLTVDLYEFSVRRILGYDLEASHYCFLTFQFI